MNDEVTSEIGFDDVVRDPNFLAILLGAAIWLVGAYLPFIGPLFVTAGFVVTVFATASTASIRPSNGAWLGLMIGALMYLVGLYLAWVPLLGFLAPLVQIPGAVLIFFFAIPLALRYSNAPLMDTFQNEWAKRSKSRTSKTEEEDTAANE
ncbi:MAG: hypothetical protein ACXABV_07965 [Candidatus Thorarchaeota archaeon]|jgi:hypothetical protein